jgi:polar amino acid transport system substrate-binding protein
MSISKQIFATLALILALIVIGALWSDRALASAPDHQQEPALRVVTKEIGPFVIKEQDRLTGFSIDLWKEIALITELPFEFVEVATVGDQLDALADGEADIAIAAISLTPEREEQFDFSYPYFRSGLQVMTTNQRQSLIEWVFSNVLTFRILLAKSILVLILIVVGHAIWLLERKKNPQFPQSYLRGVWEGIWWSAVTVTTVGYGDRIIRGVFGRVLGIFWMFAGIFLIGGFTAYVASELTVSELHAEINGPEDLRGRRVVTLIKASGTYDEIANHWFISEDG